MPPKITPNPEPWQKILYVQQPYADNYTDASFLKLLRKNENIRRDSFTSLAFQATITIGLQFSCICLFMVTFLNLNNNTWSAVYVLLSAITLTLLGLVTLNGKLEPESKISFKLKPVLKSSVLLLMMLFGLAPILKTLTFDISSDSIWALTVVALLVNALFHDYSNSPHLRIVFPGSISTNAAIFASVLLASRLPSILQVASLLSFSTVWFALFPIYQRYFRHVAPTVCFFASTFLIGATTVLIATYVRPLAWTFTFVSCIFATAFICPAALVYFRKYKNEISGPWDEARPKLSLKASRVAYIPSNPPKKFTYQKLDKFD